MSSEALCDLPGPLGKGPKAGTGSQKHALVVNDEPATSMLMQEVLISAGMDKVTLSNGTQSDEYFQKEKYDVVFVNLTEESTAGFELIRRIRKLGFNQKTPIILISKDQRPGALSKGFNAGASFFVYEPIDRARLMRLILVTQGTIDHATRRFRRVQVIAKVRLKGGNTELIGETIDVSLNGALVCVPGTLPIGTPLEVTFYLLEGSPPVRGLGSVARISLGNHEGNNRIGIVFDSLSMMESERLQDYLLPKIGG